MGSTGSGDILLVIGENVKEARSEGGYIVKIMNKQLLVYSGLACFFAVVGPVRAGDMMTNEVSARIDAVLSRMNELSKGPGRTTELIQQFKDEDIAAWPAAFNGKAATALHRRGEAYYFMKDYERALKDLELAAKLVPDNGYILNSLGDVYRARKDEQRALQAYLAAFEVDQKQHAGKAYGYMPLSATLSAANILVNQARYQEALKVVGRYDDTDIRNMAPMWGVRLLRMQGQIQAGMGNEEEALAKFKAALQREKNK